MVDVIRIGIIGCGRVAQHYISILDSEAVTGFKIVGTFDLNSNRSRHFANHFNAPPWCNPHGVKDSSGRCQGAVADGGNVGHGKLGETQIIDLSTEPTLIIDTQVDSGQYLNDIINLK
mgnify:CR=1 FL=1